MPWNEPGNGNDGNNKNDPWGKPRRPSSSPDLDETLRQLGRKLGGVFGGGNGNGRGGGGNAFAGGVLAASVGGFVLAAWVLSGFYTVNEKERAVVLRFGEYHSTEGAGLHWAPPLIDKIEQVDVSSVQQEQIKGTMLTKDENLVEVGLGVQYVVADPVAFTFNVVDSRFTLAQVAEAALRLVIGATSMDDALTSGKDAIRSRTREEIERMLEPYKTGLQITEVTLQETKAPDAVRDAFDDAIKAREDQERLVKDAESYQSKEIPLAEAQAQRLLQDAEAYRTQVVAQANGEVQRFQKLLPQYLAAPEVTRQRLYLETMEEIMGKVSKVYVDVDKGNNMLYLPLDRMAPQRQNAGAAVEAHTQAGAR